MDAIAIATWIGTGFLAAIYLMTGAMKLLKTDMMRRQNNVLEQLSDGMFRFIGTAELLGVVGLILPPAIGVAPWLAGVAALGLVLVQALAIPRHFRVGEGKRTPLNFVLLGLAAFVALVRFGAVP